MSQDGKTRTTEDIIDTPGNLSNMISARYIMREGKAPFTKFPASMVYPSYTVDWNAGDAYTDAVDQAVEIVSKEIEADPALQEMLRKPVWDEQDRTLWEAAVTAKMSDALTNDIRGGNLSQYRGDWTDAGVSRDSKINALSQDLEAGTQTMENDCDTMAITQSVILQTIDNKFLPERTEDLAATNFKVQTTYYVAYGRALREYAEGQEPPQAAAPEGEGAALAALAQGIQEQLAGLHAHIMSSETGSIVEATALRFVLPLNPDPIGDFIQGRTIYSGARPNFHYDSDTGVWAESDGHEPEFFDRAERQAHVDKYMQDVLVRYSEYALNGNLHNAQTQMEDLQSMTGDLDDKPSVQLFTELFDTMQTQGLDEDSYRMMQDLLETDEVRNFIQTVDKQESEIYKSLERAKTFALKEEELEKVQKQAVAVKLGKPDLLETLPRSLQYMQGVMGEEPESFPVQANLETMGEQLESDMDGLAPETQGMETSALEKAAKPMNPAA